MIYTLTRFWHEITSRWRLVLLWNKLCHIFLFSFPLQPTQMPKRMCDTADAESNGMTRYPMDLNDVFMLCDTLAYWKCVGHALLYMLHAASSISYLWKDMLGLFRHVLITLTQAHTPAVYMRILMAAEFTLPFRRVCSIQLIGIRSYPYNLLGRGAQMHDCMPLEICSISLNPTACHSLENTPCTHQLRDILTKLSSVFLINIHAAALVPFE